MVLQSQLSSTSVEQRVVEAAGECIRRSGWAKTTVGDISRASAVSRATIYRAFPGGRDAIFDSVRRERVVGFFRDLGGPLSDANDIASVMTDAIVAASKALAEDENFQHQLDHEPGEILRQLTFSGLDQIMVASRIYIAPHLARFVPKPEANRLAEWAARVVLTYTLEPSTYVDLTDPESARRFVTTRALTGIETVLA